MTQQNGSDPERFPLHQKFRFDIPEWKFCHFPTARLSSPVLGQGREMTDISGYLTGDDYSGTPPHDHLVNMVTS